MVCKLARSHVTWAATSESGAERTGLVCVAFKTRRNFEVELEVITARHEFGTHSTQATRGTCWQVDLRLCHVGSRLWTVACAVADSHLRSWARLSADSTEAHVDYTYMSPHVEYSTVR